MRELNIKSIINFIAINPEIIHRNAERKAKEWARNQYHSHATHASSYTMPEGITYEAEVVRLGVQITKFILQQSGEASARIYVSTSTLDWE